MTPTGNQLERQPPRADRPDPDMTPPTGVVMPPRAHVARDAPARPQVQTRARTPQDTLRALEDEPVAVRPRAPGRRPTAKMKLTRRGVGVVVTLSLVLVVAMALGIDMLTSPANPGADGPPPARAVVVTHTVAASITFDSTGGWLADDHTGTVRHFDTSTGAALGRPVRLGGRPIAVVSGFGRIWVADIAGSKVWEINPKTATVVGAPIAVAEGPVSLAAGDGGVWVASLVAGTVSLIDPRAGAVLTSGSLPDGAVRLAIGPDGVWVSGQTNSLTRVDPRPVAGVLHWKTVHVGQGPFGVGVGDGSVWVANVKSGSVSRVDPSSMRVTATYTVGGDGGGVPANPEMVAVWHNRLWVADGQEGVVAALNPATGEQTGMAVQVPGVIRQLVVQNGATLWGTTANPGTVMRFGT